MTELQVKKNTVEELNFYELTMPVDDSDYNFL